MLRLYFEIDDIIITAHKLCGPAIVLELNLQKKKEKKKRKVPPEQYYHFKNSLFEVKHLIKPFENVSCKRYAKT